MASINNAKWKLITHSGSKTGNHKMVAGYTSNGIRHNNIFFLAPLYNLNDVNMDGSVSVLEWGFGTNLYDPYSVFSLFADATASCCTIDAARQLHDYELFNKAKMGFLQSAYKTAGKALTTITIERFFKTPMDRATVSAGVKQMGQFTNTLVFLVKTGMSTAVNQAITRTQGLK